MRGWAQRLTDDQPVYEHQVVGIVCASDFPDTALVGEVIAVGADRDPETVWVVRERDKIAVEALEALGQEYVAAGLNPVFKYTMCKSRLVPDLPGVPDGGIRVQEGAGPRRSRMVFDVKSVDDRSTLREQELISCCSRVIVFKTPQTQTLDGFSDPYGVHDHIRVLERGKKKKTAQKYKKGKSLE